MRLSNGGQFNGWQSYFLAYVWGWIYEEWMIAIFESYCNVKPCIEMRAKINWIPFDLNSRRSGFYQFFFSVFVVVVAAAIKNIFPNQYSSEDTLCWQENVLNDESFVFRNHVSCEHHVICSISHSSTSFTSAYTFGFSWIFQTNETECIEMRMDWYISLIELKSWCWPFFFSLTLEHINNDDASENLKLF